MVHTNPHQSFNMAIHHSNTNSMILKIEEPENSVICSKYEKGGGALKI